MWPNPLETADLVTITEEIIYGKLHFLYSELYFIHIILLNNYFNGTS